MLTGSVANQLNPRLIVHLTDFGTINQIKLGTDNHNVTKLLNHDPTIFHTFHTPLSIMVNIGEIQSGHATLIEYQIFYIKLYLLFTWYELILMHQSPQ